MDKHVFAKFGVFVLIGMNVGAYYVFWPQQNGSARSEQETAKKEEKGEVKLVPTKLAMPKAVLPKPKELAAKPALDAFPISIPGPPKSPEKAKEPEDVVGKLLSRIKEQNEEAKDKPTVTLIPPPMPIPKAIEEKKLELPGLPTELAPPPRPKAIEEKKLELPGLPTELAPPPRPKAIEEKKLELPELPSELAPPPRPKAIEEKKLELPELPAAPTIPGDGKPKPLPPLKGEPVVPAGGDGNFGVTLPLTPKGSTGPWTLTTEPAGPQTLLIAKLQVNTRVMEFRILCDRVESKPGGSEVLALGNVVLTGADMRVDCRRLTVSLKETRLAFEEEVAVTQPNKTGVWRAELLIWENPAPAPIVNGDAKPGTLVLPK